MAQKASEKEIYALASASLIFIRFSEGLNKSIVM